MKTNCIRSTIRLIFVTTLCILPTLGMGSADEAIYPVASERIRSPGHTTYYIDPRKGDDTHSGTHRNQSWQTFSRINALLLAPGDRVEIVSPGDLMQTLMLMGKGTKKNPVTIEFAPGRYDFYPERALRRNYHISNTNDDPYTLKVIGILLQDVSHFRIEGRDAYLYFRGKAIEVCIERSKDVVLSGIHFDYHRPTVSEYTVLQVGEHYADIRIHQDSTYAIVNDRLVWIGEGWQMETGLAQELDPERGEVWRRSDPLHGLRVEELSPYHVRVHFEKNPGLTPKRIFQLRETFRDCAGAFVTESQDITWRDVGFHFLHGLGLVNQMSEDITLARVDFSPRADSGRTCAGWADFFHCSGCRGAIRVLDCQFSGSQDDPINIHGTHLRIAGQPAPDQIVVRFMHGQTYGFEAFTPGDAIEFIHADTLNPYASNRVAGVEMLNDREIRLTLKNPVPPDIHPTDVVENTTWTPKVEIRGCRVAYTPTRGFLVTTRRKILIEKNEFLHTNMSAILIADDASSWFESGYVRDATIRDNRFIQCAEPVVLISPENKIQVQPVHENIRVVGNEFDLRNTTALSAKSTRGLIFMHNRIDAPQSFKAENLVQTDSCFNVKATKNNIFITLD